MNKSLLGAKWPCPLTHEPPSTFTMLNSNIKPLRDQAHFTPSPYAWYSCAPSHAPPSPSPCAWYSSCHVVMAALRAAISGSERSRTGGM